ncbi:MAG TPA: hypothetical protein VNY73_02525 [Bacteroidia bacterium]|jgi:hypothetical protein|nr:hypothetical protein [Bacteroidia bacterium]
MIITEKFLRENARMGSNGSYHWTKKQIECLDLTWPLRFGWIARAIGKEITEEKAEQFRRLKGKKKSINQLELDF